MNDAFQKWAVLTLISVVMLLLSRVFVVDDYLRNFGDTLAVWAAIQVVLLAVMLRAARVKS